MDKDKLSSLPEKPGVYIYRDGAGKVIYIGKAKVLKNRVRSYFGEGKKDLKTEQLSSRVADIDFIVTGNELEAFILENNLIKEHKPKYNILLKDDKSYPYIMLSINDVYPGVYITRDTKDRSKIYFGPYFSADAKKVAALIYRIFKIRQCTLDLSGKPPGRPCIYYDTGLCTAPCVRLIGAGEYMSAALKVKDFLSGEYAPVIALLQGDMERLSAEKKYEKAAEIRDDIKSVGEIMKEQKMVIQGEKNMDVAGYIYRNGAYYFGVFNIRRGRLTGKTINIFREMPLNENPLEIYLSQYYSRNTLMADEVILPSGAVDEEIIQRYVFKGKKITVTFEEPGGKLLGMVEENLREKASSEEKFEKKKMDVKGEYLAQMQALKESLNLEYMPECVEGIDISHSSGDNMVGSLVVFKNGEPDKKNYRHFNIKTVGQIDDYASIDEVVERRYSRLKAEGEYFPDLILIDGGTGQVNAAKEALNRVGVDILLLGLAKEREEVFKPGGGEPVAVSEKGRFLLMRVRDEAHRFANSFRKKLANRDLKESIFDSIKGVGEKTKYRIYNEFKDFEELASAIESGDERASFLGKKQRESVLKTIKERK
ncbi:MAG: excinuclease ABC subunit UvrC [Candidatus Goldiibacteriota bacterium]|jgi:excinuclease ABC subunit C